MGNLTENFSRYEFECNCGCGFDAVDWDLLDALEREHAAFRKEYKTAIRIDITGPNRCEKHNKEEGGEKDSQHLKAKAADHKVFMKIETGWAQIPPDLVYEYLDNKYPDRYGLGQYDNRTHLDVRKRKVRWDKRVNPLKFETAIDDAVQSESARSIRN